MVDKVGQILHLLCEMLFWRMTIRLAFFGCSRGVSQVVLLFSIFNLVMEVLSKMMDSAVMRGYINGFSVPI